MIKKIIKNNQTKLIENNVRGKEEWLPILKKDLNMSKELPVMVKSYLNGVYNYNNSLIKNLPVADNVVYKLIKSYLSTNPLWQNYGKKKSRLWLRRFKKWSVNKIAVSKPEIKHTNDKVVVNLYVYNKKKNTYKNKLKNIYKSLLSLNNKRYKKNLLKKIIAYLNNYKMINLDFFSNIININKSNLKTKFNRSPLFNYNISQDVIIENKQDKQLKKTLKVKHKSSKKIKPVFNVLKNLNYSKPCNGFKAKGFNSIVVAHRNRKNLIFNNNIKLLPVKQKLEKLVFKNLISKWKVFKVLRNRFFKKKNNIELLNINLLSSTSVKFTKFTPNNLELVVNSIKKNLSNFNLNIAKSSEYSLQNTLLPYYNIKIKHNAMINKKGYSDKKKSSNNYLTWYKTHHTMNNFFYYMKRFKLYKLKDIYLKGRNFKLLKYKLWSRLISLKKKNLFNKRKLLTFKLINIYNRYRRSFKLINSKNKRFELINRGGKTFVKFYKNNNKGFGSKNIEVLNNRFKPFHVNNYLKKKYIYNGRALPVYKKNKSFNKINLPFFNKTKAKKINYIKSTERNLVDNRIENPIVSRASLPLKEFKFRKMKNKYKYKKFHKSGMYRYKSIAKLYLLKNWANLNNNSSSKKQLINALNLKNTHKKI